MWGGNVTTYQHCGENDTLTASSQITVDSVTYPSILDRSYTAVALVLLHLHVTNRQLILFIVHAQAYIVQFTVHITLKLQF